MSGRLLRFICTTALATVIVSGSSPALADPDVTRGPLPAPPPRPVAADPVGTARPAVSASPDASTADPATDPVADPAADPAADPGAHPAANPGSPDGAPLAPGAPADAVLGRLRRLYQQSEAAGQKYRATVDALKRQRSATVNVTAGLAKARMELAQSRNAAGQLAREQYQGRSGLSPYLSLLLGNDPQQALDESHQLQQASADLLAKAKRLTSAEHHADTLTTASRAALNRQQALAARQKKEYATAEARLRQAEALLATLTPGEASDVKALDQADTSAAQDQLLTSGALSGPQAAASQRGLKAVRYALTQVGKPYLWGSTGPDSFDCSGLTSQAWAHAGHTIPRTSQEQWRQLRKVSLRALRPGDLIVYFPGATHVALYIGHGQVVQAPRPGAEVKVSPLASNPVLGAVRPDAGGDPESGRHAGTDGGAGTGSGAGAGAEGQAGTSDQAGTGNQAPETSAR
ncbi:NlpC/P60 family protein [Streptomyces sp. NBC_01267]|uniref:C40 family peptidase n=1 Tax=Streptomyces sp. NBC_01267 TaxID=2903805 RepID=UPI002E36C66F|nr:NlpC/P60 family protein [Streptomyces sp. NBC_01267]